MSTDHLNYRAQYVFAFTNEEESIQMDECIHKFIDNIDMFSYGVFLTNLGNLNQEYHGSLVAQSCKRYDDGHDMLYFISLMKLSWILKKEWICTFREVDLSVEPKEYRLCVNVEYSEV